MSETTPPIPKGGSGPFIVAAIVMLLLMGGLIYWKVKGGSETPKAQETVPSATVNQPSLEEAPPPPPPIASTDTSAKPDDSKPKKIFSGGGSACGECTGDANPNMRSALTAKAGQARSCYEHALRQNNLLQGRMSISMKINQSGQVCSSSVKSELGDPGVANCVLQIFKSASLPAPSKGCVDAVVPLNFQPKI